MYVQWVLVSMLSFISRRSLMEIPTKYIRLTMMSRNFPLNCYATMITISLKIESYRYSHKVPSSSSPTPIPTHVYLFIALYNQSIWDDISLIPCQFDMPSIWLILRIIHILDFYWLPPSWWFINGHNHWCRKCVSKSDIVSNSIVTLYMIWSWWFFLFIPLCQQIEG